MSSTEIPDEDGSSVSRLTVGTLLLASTLTIMSGATISPALSAIRSAFDATPNADVLVQIVLTMSALFIAVGAPIAGAVVDRLGWTKLLFVSTTDRSTSQDALEADQADQRLTSQNPHSSVKSHIVRF